ncbi:MAG: hypothetical protein ONB44_12855 [candidate division KSB1 bacterium]|nr:hypothetical protein [candidate division KSB1 bacterium]MDZ7303009.1 hypothetical protein [candidate division KSB1 bacterium]MDZ7312483.1 hypothetical protein [candidate division KSB1 bacterium]
MIFTTVCANIFHQRKRTIAIGGGWDDRISEAEKWRPLTREQALAARDFSRAGERFIDFKGQINEILYSILTPLGYHVYVSVQALKHIRKHPIAQKYKNDIPHILNNPDLITLNHEEPDTHIFYKSLYAKLLLAIPVHLKNGFRFVATMYEMPYIKGIKQGLLSENDFLYLRGGFKWKKWR